MNLLTFENDVILMAFAPPPEGSVGPPPGGCSLCIAGASSLRYRSPLIVSSAAPILLRRSPLQRFCYARAHLHGVTLPHETPRSSCPSPVAMTEPAHAASADGLKELSSTTVRLHSRRAVPAPAPELLPYYYCYSAPLPYKAVHTVKHLCLPV